VERGTPWALWVQAHRAVQDENVPDDVRRTLLERAAAARVGQAVRTLMERAELAGLREEADQWALHAAAHGYTTPLWKLVKGREEAGLGEEAEQLAWRAPAGQRSWTLRRLAQGRAGEQAMPLLRRAYDEALAWAPGMLAERLEKAGEFVEAERLARQAADAGDRQALEELAAWRKDDDPDRQWQALLANGLTAEGSPAAPW
jgi:hypothetical protein